MSEEDNKIVKLGEGKAGRSIDKSRRSFAKGGLVAPIIMTLNSRAVLGADAAYSCTQSGNQSASPSHGFDNLVDCQVGFSPGAWKTPGSGRGDGNLRQWVLIGCNPYSAVSRGSGNANHGVSGYDQNGTPVTVYGDTKLNGSKAYLMYNFIVSNTVWAYGSSATSPTTFSSVFGSGSSDTLLKILTDQGNNPERPAVAAFLNAALNVAKGTFNPEYTYITPAYIIGIYNDTNLTIAQKTAYFESLYHPG